MQINTPIPSAADLTGNSIVLSGLSKTFGLPGLRCGWLVIKDEAMRDNIMNWKFYTSICPPVATEYLAGARGRHPHSVRSHAGQR